MQRVSGLISQNSISNPQYKIAFADAAKVIGVVNTLPFLLFVNARAER